MSKPVRIRLPEGTGASGLHSYRIEYEAVESGGYTIALTAEFDGVRRAVGLPWRIIATDTELADAIEDAKRAAAKDLVRVVDS